MGDVGPTQSLVVINGWVRTVSKSTGTADGVLDLTSDSFFGASDTGDPRVRYDRRTGRWYVLVFTIALPNRYMLAVSNGSIITASTTWTIHEWANTRTAGGVGGAAGCLGDYPTLGMDEDALYVGVNQFCGGDINTVTFDSSSAYVIRKSALPGSLVVSQFDGLATTVPATYGPYTPQGVDNFDSDTNTGYVIGVDLWTFGLLQLRRVADPAGAPSLSANISIGGAAGILATNYPPPVPQPGVSESLDAVDDRLMQAVVRSGRLWTQHAIGVTASGVASGTVDRAGVRWYELQNLGTSAADPAPTVRQSGTVFDSAATQPLSYFMGALNVNGQGHVTLGMSRGGSGASGYANAAVTGRLAGDTLGAMATPSVYTSNTAFTLNTGIQPTVSTKRWGDYSYTSVDPNDDMTMWTLQEYVRGNNEWAVRLVRLLAPPPAAVTSVSPSSVAAGQSGVALTVTGSSASGSGFFDPGAGFANRLAAAFSGTGVSVTGVSVVSPTQLALTVDTVGAASGARTLTISNPDGQVSSLSSAVTITTPVTFSVSPLSWAATAAGGTQAVTVTASHTDAAWTASSDQAWLSVSAAGGTGSGSVTLTAAALSGVMPRTGTATIAGTTVTVTQLPPQDQPIDLTIDRIDGNAVTLRWQWAGTIPDNYVLTGGLTPGATLATLPTGSTAPTFTFTAPTGAFYVRIAGVRDGVQLPPSDDVRIFVNVPEVPSAPTSVLGLSDGAALDLTWMTTWAGGAPTGFVLDVTGPVRASLPLPLTERFSYPAVPPGTYTFAVRATNAAGSSGSSAPVTLTFPGPCVAPIVPERFQAYAVGRTLHLQWDSPATGAAVTDYVLTVTGAFNMTLPLTARSISSPVPPGSYTFTVAARNACGTGPSTPAQTVTVP